MFKRKLVRTDFFDDIAVYSEVTELTPREKEVKKDIKRVPVVGRGVRTMTLDELKGGTRNGKF